MMPQSAAALRCSFNLTASDRHGGKQALGMTAVKTESEKAMMWTNDVQECV